jgi:hypothetical protein
VEARVQAGFPEQEIQAYVKDGLERCSKKCAPDIEDCVAKVQPRDDLTGKQREVAYQTDIIRRCAAPGVPDCMARLIGLANVDYFSAAARLLQRSFSPAQYLALSRDRSRKLHALEFDPILARRLCLPGDSDGDWIPDRFDRCPRTSDLTPTDDHGCPDGRLPRAPDADGVARLLDRFGLLINPACSGAPVPSEIPAGAFYYPMDLARGTYVLSGRVTNQPVRCPVWYQFDVEEFTGPNVGFTYIVVFKDTEESTDLVGMGKPVPTGYIQFNPRPGDAGTRDRLGSTGPVARIRYRVRAMNGNGSRGPWSEWKVSTRQSCWALGFDCAEQ